MRSLPPFGSSSFNRRFEPFCKSCHTAHRPLCVSFSCLPSSVTSSRSPHQGHASVTPTMVASPSSHQLLLTQQRRLSLQQPIKESSGEEPLEEFTENSDKGLDHKKSESVLANRTNPPSSARTQEQQPPEVKVFGGELRKISQKQHPSGPFFVVPA